MYQNILHNAIKQVQRKFIKYLILKEEIFPERGIDGNLLLERLSMTSKVWRNSEWYLFTYL